MNRAHPGRRPGTLERQLLTGSLVVALLTGLAAAQSTASEVDERLRDAQWEEHEVGLGVTFRRAWFASLYGAPQSLCVLRVRRPDRMRRVRIASHDGAGCAPTSRLADARRALAAVNGGFFDNDKKLPLGLLIDDGALRSEQDDLRTVAIGVDRRDRVRIENRAPGNWPGMRHARGSWPLILRKGKPVEPQGWGAADKRHPRTAAGTTRGGDLVLLTADGRNEKAAGMTLLELALVMKSLGCEAAMNLDGGGSTTMWIRSLGVVNHPCDNGRFDHDGERAVTDAVCVIAPLVLLRDEQHARCEPADGWQSGAHRDAVEGDFAVLAADDADGATARAVFEFAVDAPGRYRLELRWPKVRGGVCAVECSFAGREVVRVDGRRKPSRWQQIDAADLVVGSHEVVLTRVSAGQFAIDAIRLVEAK